MYLIIGCGLCGATIAERIANVLNNTVVIIDQRDHIGGNCYDYIDIDTGILMNKYGAHIFRTNNKKIWDYINKFDIWIRWEHKVISRVNNKLVPVPVNITTVNEVCNENIQYIEEMDKWLESNQIKYDNIENSEQMAMSRVGKILYEKMFKNYTIKQWNKDPSELNASVLASIPIRNNFDCRYFDHKYQALPKNGYTNFINNMLKNKNIKIILNTSFNKFKKKEDISKFDGIIFTGPIDEYFKDMGLEKLEYRSIDFKKTVYKNMNYFQPNSVVNYPELNVPYTRIVEYKHFLNQTSSDTVIVSETSNDYGEPYYPVPNKRNLYIYEKYKSLADKEEDHNIFFVGRLANYKYFNMDQAINAALELFENKIINL